MAYYNVIAKRNPLKPDEPSKYYAVQHTVGTLTEDLLAERVSARTGISRGIVKAVLTDVIDEVIDDVSLGYNVRLGEMGIFSLGVETFRPTATLEEFNDSHIKFAKLRLQLTKTFVEKIKAKIKMSPFSNVIGEAKVEVEKETEAEAK